jgi:hypothetical protein
LKVRKLYNDKVLAGFAEFYSRCPYSVKLNLNDEYKTVWAVELQKVEGKQMPQKLKLCLQLWIVNIPIISEVVT